MSVSPQDRAFPVFRRGEQREAFLSLFRQGLRRLIDPATGAPYTEAEVVRATQSGTKLYAHAQARDLLDLQNQQRALFLADQLRPERSSTAWLELYHGPRRNLPRLPAAGGTGEVEVTAAAAAIFVGSTTVPNAAVVRGTSKKGQLFQVFYTATADGAGLARLTMTGIDTGNVTNLLVGDEITFINGPITIVGKGLVVSAFTGGAPVETDAEWVRRMVAFDLYRSGSGNNAELREWTRKSTASIEDAFVYACALNAGSTVIAAVQKRTTTVGPTARIANAATLTAARAAMTPPGSPQVPGNVWLLLLPCVAQPVTLRIYASLARGRVTGWTDTSPWPSPPLGTRATITALASQTSFTLTTTGPVAASAAPALMVFAELTSRWERLAVTSVTGAGPAYTVTLSRAPATTLVVGATVSPDTRRREVIAEAVEAYLDSLGPGEVVNLATSVLAHRALRFPLPADEYPDTAGAAVSLYLQEALGAALSGAVYETAASSPVLPADPTLGPRLIVCGPIGLYPVPS